MYNNQWIAYVTIVRQELIRMFRVWPQTFLPSIITTSLYFLIFGKFIGAQVSNIGDHTYMQYIVPGLVMMAVITSSYMNVVSSFYGAKFMKSLEELIVAPVSYPVMIAGFVSGGVLRGVLTGLLILSEALFFTHIDMAHIWAILFFMIITSAVFSLAGLVNAIYARNFDHTTIMITFILTPLTYLGGVFYSVSMLSTAWQQVSLVNPILYMVNGFRYGFLGSSDIPVYTSVLLVSVFALIFYFWAVYLFKSGRAIRM